MARNHQSVDWTLFFQQIRPVCPWSGQAHSRGEIDITTGRVVKPLGHYSARVYVLKNWKPRRLKKLADKLDRIDVESEWLWSHPRYKHNSTPQPVLIQQNRQELNRIRSKLNRNSSV